MQVKFKLLIALFFFIIFFTSCNFFKSEKDSTGIVARVFDDYLYKSDLKGIVPDGFSKEDSLAILKDYINNWITQKLIINYAEKKLSSDELDFTKQLDEYKNSLIIYQYQRILISQKIDTNVTNGEIENYYKRNINNFQLKENIVKVSYVKLSKKTPTAQVKTYMKSDNPNDRKKLEEFCLRNAQNFLIDDDTWIKFNDILKEIPIQTYNQEEYLKNNRLIEISDSLNNYVLFIKGFMIKEGVSPLSFEKDNIKQIIINKRKLKLIDELNANLYKEGLKNNDFEIFK